MRKTPKISRVQFQNASRTLFVVTAVVLTNSGLAISQDSPAAGSGGVERGRRGEVTGTQSPDPAQPLVAADNATLRGKVKIEAFSDGLVIKGDKSDVAEIEKVIQKIEQISTEAHARNLASGNLQSEYAELENTIASTRAQASAQTLRDLITESFRVRQQLQKAEVQRLRLQLQQLEARIQVREASMQQIVDQRMQSIDKARKDSNTQQLNPGNHSASDLSRSQSAVGGAMKSVYYGSVVGLDLPILYKPEEIQDAITKGLERLKIVDTKGTPIFKREYDLAVAKHKTQVKLLKSALDENGRLLNHYQEQYQLHTTQLKKGDEGPDNRSFEMSAKIDSTTAKMKRILLLLDLYTAAGKHDAPQFTGLDASDPKTGL